MNRPVDFGQVMTRMARLTPVNATQGAERLPDPGHVQGWGNSASHYRRYAEAEPIIESILEMNPNSWLPALETISDPELREIVRVGIIERDLNYRMRGPGSGYGVGDRSWE